jgi:hypothetical protein
MEAEHSAAAALRLGDEQWGWARLRIGLNVREQRGVIVVEGVDAGVVRVMASAHARVGGAEVAGGIVGQASGGGGGSGLALPGALCALRGYEDPLAEQWVVAAVRD